MRASGWRRCSSADRSTSSPRRKARHLTKTPATSVAAGRRGRKRRSASEWRLVALAIGTGLSVANLYYSQPILALIGGELGLSGKAGLITSMTQLGYTVGLLTLVPLCDIVDRRALI